MRALVTGSAGFVGRHMVAELESRGYLVQTCDLRYEVGPMDCLDLFRKSDTRYDLVVHCAFHVGGRAAIDGEPSLLAKNLQIDSAMFDWARRTKPGRVLYFSSSAAYPIDLQALGAANTRYRLQESDVLHAAFEDCPIGEPDARYGWAKFTGELMAKAARESGVAVSVVRPFSGYGEDQDQTYPFRAIVERARAKEDPFVVWGPGTQVRDWVHIDDVVEGALAVVESGTDEPVNLCTGVGTSMLELAKLCCERVGYSPEFAPQPDKPTGVLYRVGDPTRFHRWTGLTPKVSLEEGVDRALATQPVGTTPPSSSTKGR
ncbi:MAG: NAD-dependent epimerase/dehydratase family protein [Pseudonocardia sp.]|nr:NAD-dependent epimerase/dehydratase family protein [Pseudonocardia sp.]